MKIHKHIAMIAIISFDMITHSVMLEAETRTTINIYKTGGGVDGYENVIEQHIIDDPEYLTHVLNCSDPGTKKCKWETAPTGRLIEYAESQILNGVLVGAYQDEFNSVLYRVEWSLIGDRIEIRETQEEISSIN